LFHAYVVVVINGHKSIYCFGNPSADIITLYQRNNEGIHFDAFVQVPTAIPESDVADGGEAGDEGVFVYGGVRCAAAKVTVGSDGVDSTSTASDHLADGIPLAASAPLPHTVSQGMVVYGGV
jgi:hypothetical protein